MFFLTDSLIQVNYRTLVYAVQQTFWLSVRGQHAVQLMSLLLGPTLFSFLHSPILPSSSHSYIYSYFHNGLNSYTSVSHIFL